MLNAISFYDLDDCIKVFSNLEVNNESEVKKVIRYRILLNYLIMPKAFKEIFRNSLIYYLNVDNQDDFISIYESANPAFELPENPKDFFIWLWEEIYCNEDYLTIDLINYIEINDGSELDKMFPYVNFF
ncbi:hypothetical protein EC396_14400 [Lutibacter sp. HS1-25]|nr:hypothetical protein EC396_14400 [Lutibacter sp. HS1-25]